MVPASEFRNTSSLVLLFTMVGIASHNPLVADQASFQWWLFGLGTLYATYAYYTLGFAKLFNVSALWFVLFGNIIVILFGSNHGFKDLTCFKNGSTSDSSCYNFDSICHTVCVGRNENSKIDVKKYLTLRFAQK